MHPAGLTVEAAADRLKVDLVVNAHIVHALLRGFGFGWQVRREGREAS
jgi:hypothetical protein